MLLQAVDHLAYVSVTEYEASGSQHLDLFSKYMIEQDCLHRYENKQSLSCLAKYLVDPMHALDNVNGQRDFPIKDFSRGATVEALKKTFMDCQLSCTSPLPWIWVIETLACSNQVDISLLLDLLEKTPEISDDLGRNAREVVSLRILESFFSRGARANSVESFASQKIRLDPSENCEDVLRRILTETSPSHLKPAGPEMWKWDLQPFIELKRSSYGKYALQQLKDAILTRSHSFFASLKEQSGLPVGNQGEHVNPVDDGNCNGIAPILEGNDTNGSYLLHRDVPDENLIQVNRKRKSTSENGGGKSCENQILSENGKTHIKSVKKYKLDIICGEEHLGEKLKSSSADGQLAGTSAASMQRCEGERCSLGKKTHVAGMMQDGPCRDDNNECAASKWLAGPDEALSRENQVRHCETELNNKSEAEQGQDHDSGGKKADEKDFCDLTTAKEDVAKFEPNIQRNIINGGAVEEDVGISSHSDGNIDDRSTKNNASSSHHEKVLSREKQARQRGAELPNDKFDWEQRQDHDTENVEGGKTGLHELITTNEDLDKSEQNIPRNVPIVGEAEEPVDVSSDSDGYYDEKTNIDTKKKTFLSSQCTYSQDSLATTDWRELNLCVKCNKGGKLLDCSSNSCPLLIHESCLGSDANFDTQGKFYCPFCAYSRAITKYMGTKKKASLARKDLATFMCLGTQEKSMEQSQRSCRIKQHHLEKNDDLPKSNELTDRNVVRRKKLEYEQPGPSGLHSDHSPPFGGRAVNSTNRRDQALNEDRQEGKRTRQVPRSPRVYGPHQMACKSQGENIHCPVSERNWIKKHANTKFKNSVLYPPETDLPHEHKCSQSSQSADAEEKAEEDNESSGVSKYFIRVRKQERQLSYPAIPQLRRKRLPWTREEEEALKEGMRIFCSPHDKVIPWKKILEFGAGTFQQSRCTMDLKDKWRNMCKATPKI